MATAGVHNVNSYSDARSRGPAYAHKKLHEALQNYFGCIGETKDRLYDAYLQINPLTAADFPESLQPSFRALIEAMTRRPDPTTRGEQGWIGDARNTLHGVSQQEEDEIIHLLTGLIKEVEASMGLDSTPLKVVTL